ncbi:hypothetical protein [Streptomyces sp. NBC_01477]|uniref:hypothetical protein n=1 Tax=Streptomyces sp. NBC_01477 TaxID=2976015 RepID=UPI002E37B67D|nr:hypothetical protein [Streptomyces sp. NBC_01477]
MLRNISGSLLALIGAVLAVQSPFRVWYGGRHGSDIRVDDLFTGVGVTPAAAALLGSLFLPLGFAALLALLGVLLRSRSAVGAAGVLVLGVTVLWMVRQGQSAGSLTAGGDGLDIGVAAAFGGGTLLLLGAAMMPGRTTRHIEPSPPWEQPYKKPYADAPAAAPPEPGYRPQDDDTLTLPPLSDRPPD